MAWIRRVGHCAVALLTILGAFGSAGCKKKVSADLVIISPHNKKIQVEFERAFRNWHRRRFGADVKVQWRDLGGTSTIRRYLIAQYERASTSGIDVFFGGGAPDHELLKNKGITVPVNLPAEILSQLPRTITGVRQYDPDHHWYGAAVSCFGIIYNARLLRANHLPIPSKWDDLAAPTMFGRVAAADATQSGSARAAYELIIQSAPDWPSGWAKLLKIFANCKRFTGGSSDIPADVANGEVLAGAAIDFYAYDQIAKSGPDVGFALVLGTTAFTPDPISLLKGAPHAEMGERFIRFVLSEEGQRLWCLPAGTEGGPRDHSLYRQPIRRDIYRKYKGRMLKPLVDPFERAGGFKYDQRVAGIRISRLLGPLMKAAALDSRTQLSRAWKAIIDAGQPAELLKQFAALPQDLAEEETALRTAGRLSDERQRERITSAWQRFFRNKYERIIQEAGKK